MIMATVDKGAIVRRTGFIFGSIALVCSLALVLVSAIDAWADEAFPVVDDNVFVALYSREEGGYTLVFQKGEAPRTEYGTLSEIHSLQDYRRYGSDNPIYDKKFHVRSAVVADVLQPEDVSRWFQGLANLEQVDISKLDTSKVKDAVEMFSGCLSLESLELSRFDTANLENAAGMFYQCSSLEFLDLSKFDTSKVTHMGSMFSGCSSLTSLDLSKFDTSKVTHMGSMFEDCSSLRSLSFPRGFNTGAVTSMDFMFYGCSALESIDLSGFDTSRVTNMSKMLGECSSLKSIRFPASFVTGRVTDVGSMFFLCSSLEFLDLSSFDISRGTNMDYMLNGCFSLDEIVLPATGDFVQADLPDWRDGRPLKWRNEKGEVFAADAIPARTAGTYTAVVEGSSDGDGSGNGSDGNNSGSGSGDGGNSGSGNGNGGSNGSSGSGDGSGSDNGNGGSDGGATADPAPKRTVAFSEAVTLPLNAMGVAMDKDDIVRDLAKRFGSREGFPTGAEDVAVTIMLGGEEVEAIDPRRAGTYEVTAVYAMPDGAERVIEATYTVADPAAKAPVKATVKPTTRLAQTGDEVSATAPLATAALAACALAAAIAVRRRIRG